MKQTLFACLISIVFLTTWTVAGHTANVSSKRVALIIGISEYNHSTQLQNPTRDATKLATVLSGLGFNVTLRTNLGINDFRDAVRTFADVADRSDVALVYFAGHGIEMNGKNYLIPTDAELRRDRDLDHEALTLSLIESSLEGAKRLRLILLDACRNNPFAAQMKVSGKRTRSVTRGLAAIEPAGNSLVVYAAKHGTVAEDGEGANSPFVMALAKVMPERGLEISLMFRRVRDEVIKMTNRRQQPFVYGSISGDPFYFTPPDRRPPEIAATPHSPDAPACQIWPQVATTATKAQVEAFLSECKSGIYYRLAKARLGELKGSTVATLTPPKPVVDTPKEIKPDSTAEELYNRAKDLQTGTNGAEKDYAQALSIFMQAAERGHAVAMTDIGWQYENGFGTAKNMHKAFEWYQKAAQKGERMAINNLGWMYTNGNGVAIDYKKAVNLYREAIALGEPLAMTNLGWMYETGKGVNASEKEAFKYYRKAADAGNLQGLHNVGWMYASGKGTAKNSKEGALSVYNAIRGGNQFSYNQMTTNYDIWPLEFRKEFQKLLKEDGYYRGSIDGKFGETTIAAVKAMAGK